MDTIFVAVRQEMRIQTRCSNIVKYYLLWPQQEVRNGRARHNKLHFYTYLIAIISHRFKNSMKHVQVCDNESSNVVTG
jgi:hypothetical protein